MRGLLLAGVCATSMFAAVAAQAQVVPPGPSLDEAAKPQVNSADDGVQDIVVTAQRRPERQQNVPVSVTAIDGSTLQARGLNDATQITIATPSLQLGKENSFAIRGVGTLAFTPAIDSSVATAVDEVNIGRPLAGGNTFLDVGQVEVLNGPQGLLFGKNASAGLVSITTRLPEIGKYGADFDVEADARPRGGKGAIARATLNLPISSNSALRLSGLYNYQTSLTDHVGPVPGRYDDNVRQYSVRAKYLYEPDSHLRVYLIGDYNEQHGISGFFDSSYLSVANNSVNTPALSANGVVAGRENFTLNADADGYRDLKNGGAQGKISYVTDGGVEISNIAAWRFYDIDLQIDGDLTGRDGLNQNEGTNKYNQYSNELRLALPADARLTGQMGLYYFHSDLDGTSFRGGSNYLPSFLLPQFPFCVGAPVTAGPPPNCSTSNQYFLGADKVYKLTNDSYAAFGQLTYELLAGLKVIAGGRVTHDRVAIDLTQNQRRYFVPFGAVGVFDQSYSNTNFSWRAGLQYNPLQRIMFYATYARGYKGPGFNDSPAAANTSLVIRPETSDSFEGGAKTTLFDRKLTLNVSVFHNKLSDYQAQAFDTTLRTFVVRNAASVKNKGIEANAVARPFKALTLNGAVTLLDSKFGSFPGAQCYPGQQVASCAVDGTFDAAGLRTPSSPRFTASAGGTLEHALTDEITGFVEANYYHRSSINFVISRAPGATTPPIDLLGASIGLRGDRWNAALFCKNCTNVAYPNYIDIEAGDATAGLGSYIQQFGYNSVRTIGVRLGFSF